MEESNSDEKLNPQQLSDADIYEMIAADKPVVIRGYKLGRETENYILHVLELFLRYTEKEGILEQLSYCIRELLNNAKKANTKRVFFQEEGLDIESLEDYQKGMKYFKEKTLSNIDHYLRLQEKNRLYIQSYFRLIRHSLHIIISNNAPLLNLEQEKIVYKIKKAKSFQSVEEIFQSVLDESEGAGLGILILILMLRKIGVSDRYFSVVCEKNVTHVKIEVPLSIISQEETEELSEVLAKEIDSIPQFPENIRRINKLLEDRDVDLKSVIKVIKEDPALTMDTLKMANSAGNKRMNKIDRIDLATSIIGMKGLKYLLQSHGVQKALETRYDPKIQERVWGHSYRVAKFSASLCKIYHVNDEGEYAYIGGLLHDIGRIVLLNLHEDTFQKIKKYCNEKKIQPRVVENLLRDGNYFHIGVKMAGKWGLPLELTGMIRQQINPYLADSSLQAISKMIYLANILDNKLYQGDEYLDYEAMILEEYGLGSEAEIFALLEKIQQLDREFVVK